MDPVAGTVENIIDNLKFVYDTASQNRLLKVNDVSNSPQGFKDNYASTANDFSYDNNGNMTADNNKGIASIIYNHLNLPIKINFGAKGEITYLYSATGQKLQKFVKDVVSNTTTDYLSGFQYKNTTLQFFPHAEGYVHYTKTLAAQGGANSELGSFNYVFNYTDHLGNVRVSFAKDPLQGNVLKILEENHYYPFGMKHENYNVTRLNFKFYPETGVDLVPLPAVANASYNMKYNGKSLETELGLNFYDYGARNYDPSIGRWMNIDPLAEKFPSHSPYSFCFNNPMKFVDPDGRAPLDWYLNLKTGNYEWHDGTAQKKGFVNLSATTNRKESITGGTADGKFSTSLNANGSFSINGKEYKKGSSATYGTDNSFEITSNLNLKEKALKFTSDIVAPIIETPQDVVFPIINQISVIANEGIHEGKAYNSDNVPLPNTYELNSWSLESGRSNQSTGNPTYQEGQEIINNTTSVIMLPVKAADNPATNFIIKTAVKKAVKEGMKAVE